MISYVTDIRYMPPWKPDTQYGAKYLREIAFDPGCLTALAALRD